MGMCRMIESEHRVMGSLRFIPDEISKRLSERRKIYFSEIEYSLNILKDGYL
jgi:hypothetical protein